MNWWRWIVDFDDPRPERASFVEAINTKKMMRMWSEGALGERRSFACSFPQKYYPTKDDLPVARQEIELWPRNELDLQG